MRASDRRPSLTDAARLKNIDAVFPTINTALYDYAEKNRFPAFTYGLVVDGKLVHTGSTGYADVGQKDTRHPSIAVSSGIYE